MLELNHQKNLFKYKQIWFSDYPFDVKGCSVAIFFACKNDVDLKSFIKIEDSTLIIDLTQSLDQIWSNINQSSRRSINKALRDGVRIKINENYEDFTKITNEFRRKKGISAHCRCEEILKDNNSILFVAEYNGEILGGQLYLEDKDCIYWYLNSTNRLSSNHEKAQLIANANRLMFWEAVKYSKDKGIKEFDLGGYHAANDDLGIQSYSEFKRRLGGQVTTKYIYIKYYSKKHKLASLGFRLLCNFYKNQIKTRFWCKKSGYFTKLMKSFTIEKVNQNVTKEIGTKK